MIQFCIDYSIDRNVFKNRFEVANYEYRMSDFSAFNLENFDLYKWINETIETKRPNEDFDTFLSSVSMKLQLLSQDCSDHNEEQMKLIMERLPSVVCIEL